MADSKYKVLQVGGHETLLFVYYRNFKMGLFSFDYVLRRGGVDFRFKDDPAFDGELFYLTPLQESKIKWMYELRQVIAQGKYEIVHLHLGWANVYGLLACIGLDVKLVSHNHNFYEASTFIRRLMRIPLKFIIHNLSKGGRLACSKNSFKEMFYGNGVVLKNAVDYSTFRFNLMARRRVRSQLGLADNLVFCHVGNCIQQKNHKFLIEVFSKVKRVYRGAKLLAVGDDYGTMKEAKDMVIKLGLQQDVYFLGPRRDVPDILSASDIFLFPSFFEGFGIALLEAQINGLPCIYSKDIPRDAIITQFCFPCAINKPEVNSWVEAADTFVSLGLGLEDRSYRSETVDRSYDIKNIAHELEDFYQKTLGT